MITLHFSATDGISSGAIKAFERGWCSHVDAVLPDGTLLGARSDTIGGAPPGVQIRHPDYELWTATETLQLLSPAVMENRFTDWLHDQIGKPYDKEAILAFAVGRDWRQPDSWFCSELMAAALEECGWFPHPLSDIASHITPRDLLLLVSPWAVL